MTIAAIVLCVAIGFLACFVLIAVHYMCELPRTKLVFSIVCPFLAIAAILGIVWYSFNTESGKRAYKDQQSNLSGGIERVVRVYDMEGDLIQEYRGKFDVETDNGSYVLFDDEQGKRHIIYYTTGTVIIDEQ